MDQKGKCEFLLFLIFDITSRIFHVLILSIKFADVKKYSWIIDDTVNPWVTRFIYSDIYIRIKCAFILNFFCEILFIFFQHNVCEILIFDMVYYWCWTFVFVWLNKKKLTPILLLYCNSIINSTKIKKHNCYT